MITIIFSLVGLGTRLNNIISAIILPYGTDRHACLCERQKFRAEYNIIVSPVLLVYTSAVTTAPLPLPL